MEAKKHKYRKIIKKLSSKVIIAEPFTLFIKLILIILCSSTFYFFYKNENKN